MSTEKGGGSAYPHLGNVDGMTKLDEFAKAAMQEYIREFTDVTMHKQIAEFAYKQADAMLLEREKWLK